MKKSNWFIFPRRVQNPKLRLFCFPYAGASATLPTFREWAQALPSDIELVTLQLPGRGARHGEQLIADMPELIQSLAAAVALLLDRPYALFGHSIGALIAFELARELRRRALSQPELLLVSGKRAPQLPHKQRLHQLPDPELIEALRDYNGTPKEVLQNLELMQLFLPVLRADFSLAETYVHTEEAPLAIPIHAFCGDEDQGVSEGCMERWASHTTRSFSLEMCKGDHFFIQGEGRAAVLARVIKLTHGLLSRTAERGDSLQTGLDLFRPCNRL